MRRALLFGMLAAVTFAVFSGCAAVLVNAPAGQDVKLIAETAPAGTTVVMKNWYVLWGLVPLTNNSTAPIIQQNGFKNVRVKTYYSFLDYIINAIVGSVSITTNTVEITGSTQ